ncbi:MAG TPA: mannose-1-phosphate guanylyltransferase [Rikenellaceae bacterium]|nr:mannose-1-phosphate guanylyltransferase [Rikenellaceae bacterium]
MCKNNNYYCVIMAGGLGTRFWPISRKSMPKQFLDLNNTGKSLLRQTYERMSRLIPQENILVSTLREYHDLVKAQLPEIKEDNILQEVYNRNTAPCLYFAANVIVQRNPQAVMVACPSDHLIENDDDFEKSIEKALVYASDNNELITLGIMPTRPDDNFGYIQVSGGRAAIEAGEPVKVKTFTEKPSTEIAIAFIKSGEFLWNSGIFIWKASLIISEIKTYAPQISELWAGTSNLDRFYGDCTRVSIDYAVMEKTDKATVIPAKFKWADMGNWESLYDNLPHDEKGNSTNFRGKHLFKEDANNMVYITDNSKLVAIRGLENFVVVDTPDVMMICPRDESQIQDFISELAMPEFEDYR